MGPLAAIVAMFWAASIIAVAINISEKQESVRAAILMLFTQICLIAVGLMPIVLGIINAS